jgi:hypothetical protein
MIVPFETIFNFLQNVANRKFLIHFNVRCGRGVSNIFSGTKPTEDSLDDSMCRNAAAHKAHFLGNEANGGFLL